MKIRQVASSDNLTLAWRRITTGGNQAYKRFFRPLYYAYELSLESNLKDLRNRIMSGAWQPCSPDRIYIPKPSGLQRPITLLYIEDQIILQAVANIIARKLFVRRQPLIFRQIFSNILNPPNNIFFLRNWKQTYAAFQKMVREQYNAGRHWVADFDLASFYDTVSHDLLLRTAYPRLAETDDFKWVCNCLRTWSAAKVSSSKGHGLPQGPIASDFLAECFLLPIDRIMSNITGYIRYVDDVRLFGRTENDVRRAMIRLEVQCRERGLIPQTGKFAIRRASSLGDALGMLPSINDSEDGDDANQTLDKNAAFKLLKSSRGGRPLKIKDKTRARYVLYRAESSAKLLKLVSSLTPRHPEHIDAFVVHFSRYGYRESIKDLCLNLLKDSPYNYVRGEMWHILARHYEQPVRFTTVEREELVRQAIEMVKSREADTALKWGAGHFLCVADVKDHRRYCKFLNYQDSSLLQALVAPHLPVTALAPGGAAYHFLRRSAFEPALALADPLHRSGKTPCSLGVQDSKLTTQARNVFTKLGLVRGVTRTVDVIGEVIQRRYGVASSGQWRLFLGSDYAHVAGLLALADAVYLSGPSHWLSMQNSFNHAVFLALQKHLLTSSKPGIVRTINSKGQLISFGVTLDQNNVFSKSYPLVANVFREGNDRRNRLPASHPYETKSLVRNSYLKAQERNRLLNLFSKAYGEIVKLIP